MSLLFLSCCELYCRSHPPSILPLPLLFYLLTFNICYSQGMLTHEVDEGSPCLKCGDSCPGFSLHFWRYSPPSPKILCCSFPSLLHIAIFYLPPPPLSMLSVVSFLRFYKKISPCHKLSNVDAEHALNLFWQDFVKLLTLSFSLLSTPPII